MFYLEVHGGGGSIIRVGVRFTYTHQVEDDSELSEDFVVLVGFDLICICI